MTNQDRFLSLMEYKSIDRVPNYEVGVWGQTIDRWKAEGLDTDAVNWDWFRGASSFNMDSREYIDINFGMLPGFEYEVIEETDRYEIFRSHNGIVRKALKTGTSRGTRASMDQFLSHPVQSPEDFHKILKRYDPTTPTRYPEYWEEQRLSGWTRRNHVLVLGRNCSTLGFYWRAREWMGTEALSYAWYDFPKLMHEMMEFIADFTIAVARPVLEKVDVDYVFINEDMAMKQGPLLSPATYEEFVYPHMRRLVDFFKSNHVAYVVVDSDGNTEPLIPLLMKAGVDAIWPMERASEDMVPGDLRRKYGKDLRLWGGVDKREIAKGRLAIDAHLRSLAPLVEDGGFIPTIDHTVPPDVSLDNFRYYVEQKAKLLAGEL